MNSALGARVLSVSPAVSECVGGVGVGGQGDQGSREELPVRKWESPRCKEPRPMSPSRKACGREAGKLVTVSAL